MAERPTSSSSSPSSHSSALLPSSRRLLPFDLLTSYEQVSFIRYPPDLTSLRLHRFTFTALGLPQGERWWRWWPSKTAESNAGWLAESSWGDCQATLWLWQLLWALCFLASLLWVTWTRATGEEDSGELTINRVALSLCSVLSFSSAVLLAHSLLVRRSVPTRSYYLHRNSRAPHLAVGAIDRALYSGLAAFAVLAISGLHIDVMRRAPPSLALVTTGYTNSLTVQVRDLTILFCLTVLRLHFVAALTLFTTLLNIHSLRVQQATTEVRAPHCDEEGLTAQLVDVDLALHDASHRLGWKVAIILCATCTETAIRWVELVRHEGDERSASATLASFCYGCALVLFVVWPVARLNATCARLQSAVASFPLLRAAYPRPIACPELSFDLVGVRTGYSTVASFALVAGVALLWVMQRDADAANRPQSFVSQY